MAGAFETIIGLSQGADVAARRSSEMAKQRGTMLGMNLGQSLRQQERDERRDMEADRSFALQEEQMRRDWDMRDALFPLQKKNMELQGLLLSSNVQRANAEATIADVNAAETLKQTTYERDEAQSYADYKNSIRQWSMNPSTVPPPMPSFKSDRYNALAERDYTRAQASEIVKERSKIFTANALAEKSAENALYASGLDPQVVSGMTYQQKLAEAKKVGWQDTVRQTNLETNARIDVANAQAKSRLENQIAINNQKYSTIQGRMSDIDKRRWDASMKSIGQNALINPEAAARAQQEMDTISAKYGGGSGPTIETSPSSTTIKNQSEYDSLPKGSSFIWNGKSYIKQ